MSHEDTNTSTHASKTLTEIKKERKQYQQDAIMLSNRIKLLQIEEKKTWKQIKETQKKQAELESIRRRKEENCKFREEILKASEKEQEKNKKKVKELKEQIKSSLKKNKNFIQDSKKKSYVEIRNLRDQSIEMKNRYSQEIIQENQQRSKSVKIEHAQQSLRAKKFKMSIQSHSKHEYLKRVNEEVQQKKQIESKVSELEVLELELIKRLQNTQNIQQKVVSEYKGMRSNP